MTEPTRQLFLTLDQVSDELNTSSAQTSALVRSGALRAIKIGGRGQWRIAHEDLERYIAQAYQDTQEFIRNHQWGDVDADASNREEQKE